MASSPLMLRKVQFDFPEGTDPVWNKRFPEFAHATNSISLLMPHAEPYFIRVTRAALPQLEGDLLEQTKDFITQEARHYRQHRRFNDVIGAKYPAIPKLERVIGSAYGWLGRTRSLEFNLAFVAGSETMAFAIARWTEAHLTTMFDDADPMPATMYMWHLAEEVEHKSCAYDVFETIDGSRIRYTLAMLLSFLLLVVFCTTAVVIMLWRDRRLFHPVTIYRLVKWGFSFSFSVLPVMASSAMPRHHPSHLTNPVYLPTWLSQYDPETETMPMWESARPSGDSSSAGAAA